MKPSTDPVSIQLRARELFDQQLWCWGRDILRPEGNLLVQFGLQKHRPQKPATGSTLYIAELDHGATLWLWGFGVLVRRPGEEGVFFRRYRLDPQLVKRDPVTPVHAPDSLGKLHRPRATQSLQQAEAAWKLLADWSAEYEHFIRESAGLVYRQNTINLRGKPDAISAKDMAEEWEKMKKHSRRVISGTETTSHWGVCLKRLRQHLPQTQTRQSQDQRIPYPARRTQYAG